MFMRVMYVGMDKRTRVAESTGVKFLEDGFKSTDRSNERDDEITGPVIVMHTLRNKGGKRIMMEMDTRFDMNKAQIQLLENGWLDLTEGTVRMENLY